ncbi:MAG: DUF3667 domain-containing protein [Telluria sp.]
MQPDHRTACANCATVLEGQFCHGCGQKAHLHTSLLHLGEEVLHGVLHFDSKGLRTLPMLAVRPGVLTRLYIDGHRTRYVSPLALFLFMIFTMFFIGSLTSGKALQSVSEAPQAVRDAKVQFDAEMGASKAKVAKANTALAMARARGGDTSSAQEALDSAQQEAASTEEALNLVNGASAYVGSGNFTANTGWKAADDALMHAAANKELTFYKLRSAGSKFSFLLVPITLPFLWLLFCRRRDLTMYDHAVFALYSLSFMAVLFSLAFVLRFAGLTSVAVWLVCVVPPVHMYLQLRGTYTLGRAPALWRAGALVMIAALVFLLYLLLILVLSVR